MPGPGKKNRKLHTQTYSLQKGFPAAKYPSPNCQEYKLVLSQTVPTTKVLYEHVATNILPLLVTQNSTFAAEKYYSTLAKQNKDNVDTKELLYFP